MTLLEILQPRTELEEKIILDPEFIRGAMWGVPRKGHPEGMVVHHIAEVLNNIDTLDSKRTKQSIENLRLIALIHDTFKYKVDRSLPRTGPNHHGYIAKLFAEKYTSNYHVLTIIETHDDAYNAWVIGNKRGDWKEAEKRAMRLYQQVSPCIYQYCDFYECDCKTGDKSMKPYNWFIDLISKRKQF